MTVWGRPAYNFESILKIYIIKDGNSDVVVDTARVGACRILLWAEAIAANVKSQQEGISTLQTPLKYLFHT